MRLPRRIFRVGDIKQSIRPYANFDLDSRTNKDGSFRIANIARQVPVPRHKLNLAITDILAPLTGAGTAIESGLGAHQPCFHP